MTGVSSATAAPQGTSPTTQPAGSMDQNDFLKLMTTQLTTQDPFNPVDNTQMVAQMAQFSQVAGIAEMNQSLKTLVGQLAPGRLADAASWIGRSVLVQSDKVTAAQDGSYSGEIALPRNADRVTLSLVDESGAEVHREDLGAQSQGTVRFSWNGRDAQGTQVATGPLKVVVDAEAGGNSLDTAIACWTQVTAIQSPASGGSTQLLTPLGAISPDAAIRLA